MPDLYNTILEKERCLNKALNNTDDENLNVCQGLSTRIVVLTNQIKNSAW